MDLTVEDAGPGVPERDLGRIFDRFARLEPTTASTRRGVGLGLSVVRGMAAAMGADVSARAKLARRAGDDHSAGGAPANRGGFVSDGMRRRPGCSSSRTTNRCVRRSRRTCAAMATRSEAVESGEAALDAGRDGRPDLVLLDLGLPGIDGIQVVTRLRREATTPIIILSARDEERDKVAALDAGADDYLTKPFGMDELQARVRAALRRAGWSDGVDRWRGPDRPARARPGATPVPGFTGSRCT